MNKTLSIILALVVIIVVGVVLLNKHGNTPLLGKSDQAVELHVAATIPEGATPITDGNYNVWEGSFVDWAANKTVLPTWVDRGSVQMPTGSVVVSAGVPVAGTFELDMNSITASETGGGNDEGTTTKLAEHLKSPDWFNSAQYPKATFTLTKVVASGEPMKYTVTGRLTLKDIQQEITFDAYIYELMGKMMIQGSADIDRTLWDIRFGSSKFFQDLGDKVINDVFVVNFNIATMKAQ